jgi:hypothetical protein
MSWIVKRWGKGKYGLWTTVADGYLHEPKKVSKEELIEFISQMWRDDIEEKIKKLEETFPEGWFDKDTMKMLSKED